MAHVRTQIRDAVVTALSGAGLPDVGVGPDAALETASAAHDRTRVQFVSDERRRDVLGPRYLSALEFLVVGVVESEATVAATDARLDALEVVYVETIRGDAGVGALVRDRRWIRTGERSIEATDRRIKGRTEVRFRAIYEVSEADLEVAL